MDRIFAYDSPVWKFMGRLVDFFVLTILWFVTSLPIITMGTATTTVYYITLKMAENKEEYLVSMYFKTFVRLFRETVTVWVGIMAVVLFGVADVVICLRLDTSYATMFLTAFTVLAVIFMMVVSYLFPVMARLDNHALGYMKAAFYLAIKYFGWSLLIVVIPVCLVIVGVFAFWPLLFVVVGLAAYLQTLIFHQIFKQQGWLE